MITCITEQHRENRDKQRELGKRKRKMLHGIAWYRDAASADEI